MVRDRQAACLYLCTKQDESRQTGPDVRHSAPNDPSHGGARKPDASSLSWTDRLTALGAGFGPRARGFLWRPEPRFPGSVVAGRQLMAGNFRFGGALIEAPDTSPGRSHRQMRPFATRCMASRGSAILPSCPMPRAAPSLRPGSSTGHAATGAALARAGRRTLREGARSAGSATRFFC
jgi:hypothetical protein